MGCAEST
jgi:HELP motif